MAVKNFIYVPSQVTEKTPKVSGDYFTDGGELYFYKPNKTWHDYRAVICKPTWWLEKQSLNKFLTNNKPKTIKQKV